MMTVKMTVRVIADNHSQTALKAQDNVMYVVLTNFSPVLHFVKKPAIGFALQIK